MFVHYGCILKGLWMDILSLPLWNENCVRWPKVSLIWISCQGRHPNWLCLLYDNKL